MSRSVQRPPSHGRGYSVRDVTSRGGGIGSLPLSNRRVRCPRPSSPVAPDAAACPGCAFRCSIGPATRALATSVSSPTWLCHHPLHAIAPCQKFVYVEL